MIIRELKQYSEMAAKRVECNMCGAITDINFGAEWEYAEVVYSGGYHSKIEDGYSFTIEICDDCIVNRLNPMLKTKIPLTSDVCESCNQHVGFKEVPGDRFATACNNCGGDYFK